MKTNQSTAATPVAAQSTLISPVLFECMAQLKKVRCRIFNFCEQRPDLKDDIDDSFREIEDKMADVACELSQIMRQELLASTFYAE